jgi:HD-GYP domain-containing protein (c-di-GMP phosphodiesterase class II)
MVPCMLRSLSHRPAVLVIMAALATLPGAVLERFGDEPVSVTGFAHFAAVGTAGLLAAAASAGLTVAGVRARDGRTVLLGCAFSTMTALLAVHAVATPGVLVGPNGVVALAGALSLPVGAAVLALSAIPALRRPHRLAGLLILQAALAGGVLLLGGLALARPTLVPAVPASGSTAARALLAVGLTFYALLAHRALRTYGLTHRRGDLLVAVGCAWLGLALVPQMLMSPATLGFYVGHGLELAGVALLGIPAALDLRRGRASRPLVGDLSATEVVAAEEAFLGPRLRALLLRLGQKDVATEQHTRRVALLAVRVGERLRVPPTTLRDLAIGGLLHDIGKLSVSTAILQKPGRLDKHEFAEIQRHPQAGVDLLRQLGGFSGLVLDLVAQHHERLDGSGYPRGLGAAELGTAARILAVCDVFDALVSDRVYRDAWTVERALALLHEQAGTKLDARSAHALSEVLSSSGLAPPDQILAKPAFAA